MKKPNEIHAIYNLLYEIKIFINLAPGISCLTVACFADQITFFLSQAEYMLELLSFLCIFFLYICVSTAILAKALLRQLVILPIVTIIYRSEVH